MGRQPLLSVFFLKSLVAAQLVFLQIIFQTQSSAEDQNIQCRFSLMQLTRPKQPEILHLEHAGTTHCLFGYRS